MKHNFWIGIFLVIFSFSARAEQSLIKARWILDVENSRLIQNSAVLIDGQKISNIIPASEFKSNLKSIDLGEATLMPGWIDAHVHLIINSDDYQLKHLQQSSAEQSLLALHRAQLLMREGWTTVRIAGDTSLCYPVIEVKKKINEGMFEGPRIVGAAHYISVTGGAGDMNFLSPEQNIRAEGLVADGGDAMRKAVRDEIKNGADWIKILVTGGFMSAGDNPNDVHMASDELKAVVEEASRRSTPVMAHAHSALGIKQAILAGVRSIEHATFIDDEGIKLLIAKGTYAVPTFAIDAYYEKFYSNTEAQRKYMNLVKATSKEYHAQMRKLFASKAKIGLGTDLGGYAHPEFNSNEFLIRAGLGNKPIDVIRSATIGNAEMLKVDKEIG